MLEILERIVEGKGKMEDLDRLEEIADFVKTNSLCGLGKSAPLPVISTLKTFRDEYVEHIVDKKCKSHTCQAMKVYRIDAEKMYRMYEMCEELSGWCDHRGKEESTYDRYDEMYPLWCLCRGL